MPHEFSSYSSPIYNLKVLQCRTTSLQNNLLSSYTIHSFIEFTMQSYRSTLHFRNHSRKFNKFYQDEPRPYDLLAIFI